MNKKLIQQWRSEEGLAQLREWEREGLAMDEIAQRMGLPRSTFYDWLKRYPDIGEALGRGQDADCLVEQALLEKALGGDLRAQMYWLNNRSPQRWQESSKSKTKGKNDAHGDDDTVTVVVDV